MSLVALALPTDTAEALAPNVPNLLQPGCRHRRRALKLFRLRCEVCRCSWQKRCSRPGTPKCTRRAPASQPSAKPHRWCTGVHPTADFGPVAARGRPRARRAVCWCPAPAWEAAAVGAGASPRAMPVTLSGCAKQSRSMIGSGAPRPRLARSHIIKLLPRGSTFLLDCWHLARRGSFAGGAAGCIVTGGAKGRAPGCIVEADVPFTVHKFVCNRQYKVQPGLCLCDSKRGRGGGGMASPSRAQEYAVRTGDADFVPRQLLDDAMVRVLRQRACTRVHTWERRLLQRRKAVLYERLAWKSAADVVAAGGRGASEAEAGRGKRAEPARNGNGA